MNLEGKKVCIITDDWGRPTPVSEFLPQIIDGLKATRIKDEDLGIVTGSSMHNIVFRYFTLSANIPARQMYGEVSHIQIWVCRLSRKKVTLLGMEGYVA